MLYIAVVVFVVAALVVFIIISVVPCCVKKRKCKFDIPIINNTLGHYTFR